MKKTLWRAADDDMIIDTASFAASRAAAEAYLNNGPFGGKTLYRARVEIEPSALLDLFESADPVAEIVAATGLPHPGAINADEWVPRIGAELQDAGYEWVRVRDTYPAGSETWTFVGIDDPDMEEVA